MSIIVASILCQMLNPCPLIPDLGGGKVAERE